MHRLLALAVAVVLAGSARAQDGAEFVVRLNRVEGQMRQLSGQVEQLQFENRQLKEQLRKFQEDTEFRFSERPGAKPSATPAPKPAPRERPERRSDAFDPAADPAAPGVPRPLGSGQGPVTAGGPPPGPLAALPPERFQGQERGYGPQVPRGAVIASPDDDDDDDGLTPDPRRAPDPRLAAGPQAPARVQPQVGPQQQAGPLDLGAAGRGGRDGAAALPPQASLGPPRAAEPAAPPRISSTVSPGSGDPRADFDVAYAFLIQGQFERAETAFRGFLQTHSRDRLVPDAVFGLGESYLGRNRPREAAEQFLKVSTEHARSPKAPDALLKLGIALTALGARDQACATLAEVERKYPGASASVRQGVDREQKRARCLS